MWSKIFPSFSTCHKRNTVNERDNMREFDKQYRLHKGTSAPERCTCGMHFNCCCGGTFKREEYQRVFNAGNDNRGSSDRDFDIWSTAIHENCSERPNAQADTENFGQISNR